MLTLIDAALPLLWAAAAVLACVVIVDSIRKALICISEACPDELPELTPYTGPLYNRHGREIVAPEVRYV